MQKGTISTTSLLTCLHLLVDGLCACCVFMLAPSLGAASSLMLFVLYNALAFLTQPIVGLLADKRADCTNIFKTSIACLIIGACIALVANSIETKVAILPYLSIAMVGIGNSLFHVFGGKSVAMQSRNDMRHLGVFVSSGAIGLIIGEQSATVVGLAIICLALLSFAFALLRSMEPCQREKDVPDKPQGIRTFPLILFILLIVFIRAFIGNVSPQSPDAQNPIIYGILFSILAFAGKSLGGFIGRKAGVWKTLTITLLISGICFTLYNIHIAFSLVMVLAINLTMPLTLYLANHCLPGREGFSFGLLAAMLPLGVAMGNVGANIPLVQPLLYALIATIIIEAFVLLAMNERHWQVLAMSVVMNILTNLPLNILVYNFPQIHTSLPLQIGLECGVVTVEALLYWTVLRDKRKAITYAILCNAISYLLGMLYSMVI